MLIISAVYTTKITLHTHTPIPSQTNNYTNVITEDLTLPGH